MKRITFKLNQFHHRQLKRIVANRKTKINKLITEYVQDFTKRYEKGNGEDLKNIFVSKDEIYSEGDDLVTVSIEFEDNLHKAVKLICAENDRKVKHFMRGIVLYIINENNIEKRAFVCRQLPDSIDKSALAVAYTREEAIEMIYKAAIEDGWELNKKDIKLELVDDVTLIDYIL